MKPYKISLWVYADNDADPSALETELYNFVKEKQEKQIAVKATTLRRLLNRFKDNPILNTILRG